MRQIEESVSFIAPYTPSSPLSGALFTTSSSVGTMSWPMSTDVSALSFALSRFSARFFSSSFAIKAEPYLPEPDDADEPLAADAALVSGVERPREAEAPLLSYLGGTATGAPPIEVPLPEKALNPAADEFELAAAEAPLSLSADEDAFPLALVLFAPPPLRLLRNPPPKPPPELVPGMISPPQAAPAVLKYGLSAAYLNGHLLSSIVARAAEHSILLNRPK